MNRIRDAAVFSTSWLVEALALKTRLFFAPRVRRGQVAGNVPKESPRCGPRYGRKPDAEWSHLKAAALL
jgi:hypothetical protein